MGILPVLIGWPVLMAAVVPFIKSVRARSIAVYVGSGGVMALAVAFLAAWLLGGAPVTAFYKETEDVYKRQIAG